MTTSRWSARCWTRLPAPSSARSSARAGHAAGVLGALAGLDELGEDPAGQQLVLRRERLVDLLGVAGQGALDAPDLLVGGVGQPAEVEALPEQGQGELEQGQVARLVGDVVQQPVDQAGLEGGALGVRGLLDGGAELVARHRSQQLRGGLQRIGKRTMRKRLAHEVGAEGDEEREVSRLRRGVDG